MEEVAVYQEEQARSDPDPKAQEPVWNEWKLPALKQVS
jgi:hypothetical protein